MTKQTKGHVEQLGRAFGATAGWAGAILGRINVQVDASGHYDLDEGRLALEQAIMNMQPRGVDLNNLFVASEMGPDEESCRRWFISQLEQIGLKEEGRRGRRASDIRFVRPDGSDFRVMTYVSLREKANKQIGYTVNNFDKENALDWICFVAKPWGKAFLRRRKEILVSMDIPEGKAPKIINLTFSPKTNKDLLANRIDELVEV